MHIYTGRHPIVVKKKKKASASYIAKRSNNRVFFDYVLRQFMWKHKKYDHLPGYIHSNHWRTQQIPILLLTPIKKLAQHVEIAFPNHFWAQLSSNSRNRFKLDRTLHKTYERTKLYKQVFVSKLKCAFTHRTCTCMFSSWETCRAANPTVKIRIMAHPTLTHPHFTKCTYQQQEQWSYRTLNGQ